VGNAKQPFSRLLEAVSAIVAELPKPIVVQHGNTPFFDASCERHAFLDRDSVSALMDRAELVVCHAGAGCVIEALRSGKTPVVMSRRREHGEHIDDHQVEFAKVLLQSGKALVVENPAELRQAVARASLSGRTKLPGGAEPPLVSRMRELLQAIAAKRDRGVP
jgi:UDP-N-acetylglucosamine transferase subunit ALG13